MDDKDVRWAANSMIRLFGPSAAMEAAMTADKMQAREDIEGLDLWQRITGAIREHDRQHMPSDMERQPHN